MDSKGLDWKELREELLGEPSVRAEYERLAPEYELRCAIIEARRQRGLTQKQLAEKIGTKQANISNLESGNGNPSYAFLKRVAQGLGKRLQVTLTDGR
jgi:ribosome-binding protein aMBF1 (putative translation factor)